MKKCLTCGEPIEDLPGKRPKKYCNSLCKLRHWQRNNRRPIGKKVSPAKPEVLTERQLIERQIAVIKAEIVPALRNTILGRKSWELEQKKKIQELQEKLNTLNN